MYEKYTVNPDVRADRFDVAATCYEVPVFQLTKLLQQSCLNPNQR